MAGANIVVALVGIVVGAYFAFGVYKQRGKAKQETINMMIAISMGCLTGASLRLQTLPSIYENIGSAKGVGFMYQFTQILSVSILCLSAYAFTLHLKPVFYWIPLRVWNILTGFAVVVAVIAGALLVYALNL